MVRMLCENDDCWANSPGDEHLTNKNATQELNPSDTKNKVKADGRNKTALDNKGKLDYKVSSRDNEFVLACRRSRNSYENPQRQNNR